MNLRGYSLPTVFLLTFAALTFRASRDHKVLASLESSAPPRGGPPLCAIDFNKRQLSIVSLKARQVAVFVLHPDTLDPQTAFWTQVAHALPPDTSAIGVCEGRGCVDQIRRRTDISFPVVEFGSYQALLAAIKHDESNRVAVFEPNGQILFTVPKMTTAKQQADVIARGTDVAVH